MMRGSTRRFIPDSRVESCPRAGMRSLSPNMVRSPRRKRANCHPARENDFMKDLRKAQLARLGSDQQYATAHVRGSKEARRSVQRSGAAAEPPVTAHARLHVDDRTAGRDPHVRIAIASMSGAASKIPIVATAMFRARRVLSPSRRCRGIIAIRARKRIVQGVRAGGGPPGDVMAELRLTCSSDGPLCGWEVAQIAHISCKARSHL